MVNVGIKALVEYGIEKQLITQEDKEFAINSILEVLKLDEYEEPTTELSYSMTIEEILNILISDAVKREIIEDSIVYKDLLDTKLMSTLVPFPREVITKFYELYKSSPKVATDWYYDFSQNTDYIRRYRMVKDVRWVTKTKYGDIDITINLSKPEKDPIAIAAAKNAPQIGYPKCLLCSENQGYAGRTNHPARQNHRIIPVEIAGNKWYFQYSPYVYYNEHCIVFNSQHIPMKIDRNVFEKMFDFILLFPHYFVGSNADLPIVGGSILSHDHFQGGNYTFAMEKAEIIKKIAFEKYPQVEAGILNWPMSVIRITSEDHNILVDLAEEILNNWRNYTDEDAFVFAYTDNEPHNTITPIARKKDGKFQLDLVLRNNITTEEFPLGVYHPHQHLHHIKKENIGLIEVMGLAVLPARLKDELELVKQAILNDEDVYSNKEIEKHGDWVKEILVKNKDINLNNIDDIIKDEVGLVFEEVLENAGVYKCTEEGRKAFLKFVHNCGGEGI